MASQTLIGGHKITVMTSQTQFGSQKVLIKSKQEMLMASQTLIGSHKITVMISQTQIGSHKQTRIARGFPESDWEPQDNSHDIPMSSGVKALMRSKQELLMASMYQIGSYKIIFNHDIPESVRKLQVIRINQEMLMHPRL